MTVAEKADVLRPFDDLLADTAFWSAFEVQIASQVTPVFFEIFVAGYVAGSALVPIRQKALPDTVPAPLDPESIAAFAEQAIFDYVPVFTKSFTKTTYDAVQKAVVNARRDGTGVEGVIRAITPLFGPERAEIVGITETTNLFGRGAQASYKAQGINGWRWETVNDPWVDADCQGLQDEVFPIDKLFEARHPRCRCWSAPVLIDEDSKPQASSLRSRVVRLLRLPYRPSASREQLEP